MRERKKKRGEGEREEEECIAMECREPPRRLIQALCEVTGVKSLAHHSGPLDAPYLSLWL